MRRSRVTGDRSSRLPTTPTEPAKIAAYQQEPLGGRCLHERRNLSVAAIFWSGDDQQWTNPSGSLSLIHTQFFERAWSAPSRARTGCPSSVREKPSNSSTTSVRATPIRRSQLGLDWLSTTKVYLTQLFKKLRVRSHLQATIAARNQMRWTPAVVHFWQWRTITSLFAHHRLNKEGRAEAAVWCKGT